MPVFVNGNTKSGIFILYLHGGPGASAMYDKFGNFFSGIEKKHAVVYWEQRASGISQGNTQKNTVTVSQYFEDIDHVLKLISIQYNNPAVILMGHSWGGGLGAAYLTQRAGSNYNNIKAWINIDGDHNDHLSDSLSAIFVRKFAKQQIRKGNDTAYWMSALKYYDTVSFKKLTYRHTRYLTKAGGLWYGRPHNYASYTNIFFSYSTGFDFLSNNPHVQKFLSNEDLMSFTKDLKKITLPSLILWGKHDGTIPVEMATDFFDKIGTTDDLKKIVLFEKSAHSPYIEEKEKFNTVVTDFIATLKNKNFSY